MKKTDIQKTSVRLPKDLHELIHQAFDENNRSMNAEIVERLQVSYRNATVKEESGSYGTSEIRELIESNKKLYELVVEAIRKFGVTLYKILFLRLS